MEAANFETKDIDNKKISLNKFRGKYVLLNFWASWCIPCIKEIPELIELSKRYQAKSFEILNISIDENRKKWMESVTKNKIQNFYNVLANDDIKTKYSNTNQPIPSQILINRKGIVIWNSLNQSAESLEKILSKVLANEL